MRQVESLHWHRQRYGGSFVVSLEWTAFAKPILPLRNPSNQAKSPPPDSHRYLPKGIKNQKRAPLRDAGVQGQKHNERNPRLSDVQPEDLSDPKRTGVLFAQAVKAGIVKDSQAERLRVFAAAARAKRKAYNPGGFFLTVLRKGLWQNIAARDEEQARRELLRLDDFATERRHCEKPIPPPLPNDYPLLEPERVDADRAAIRELIRASLASVTSNSFPPPTSC
jgi:hypothetical protein